MLNCINFKRLLFNSMKKFYILFFLLITLNSIGQAKETTFNKEIFLKAQKEGKLVVVNSWNETCTTCSEQIKILNQAKADFKNVIFLSFEQTKDKETAKFLKIDYWTTIIVYKDNKEISRMIGQTDKDLIYSNIKKGI